MEEGNEMVVPKDVQEEEDGGKITRVMVTGLGSPTREEMRAMLMECEGEPEGGTRNWKVAEVLRNCLDLDEELSRVHQAVWDRDHERLEKRVEARLRRERTGRGRG